MFRSTVLFCCFYFVALTPYLTFAMTADQKAKVHAHFEELGMACMGDYPITSDDITSFRAKKMASSPNAPCFVACMLKKIGLMDDKGMIQKETAIDLAKKIFDDPEELKNIQDYLHSCNHVNTAAVGDGEKGCERASLAFNCMVENASQAQQAKQKPEFKDIFLEKGSNCLNVYPISAEDLKSFEQYKIPRGENVACFITCVFRYVGFLNNNGMIAPTQLLANSNEFLDNVDIENVKKFFSTCSKVNYMVVETECDRAMLAYTCLVKNTE